MRMHWRVLGVGVAALMLLGAERSEVDLAAARAEVDQHYSKASPEVQEWVMETARSFGPGGLWVNEDGYATLTGEEREKRVVYLKRLLEEGEYGRHLCMGLAEASAIKDARLVPGLMKVAGYSVEGKDYDCRPKWMAVAALARQESEAAVPLLVSLVDHGNQNTRLWARAALARMLGADLKGDKQAWNKLWVEKGHAGIEGKYLKAYVAPGG
ncbi:MAG: HEAT repeat domain-containing protein [Phycisphaerae bacterium]